MSYEQIPAAQLLPHYPPRAQELYAAVGFGKPEWITLSRSEQLDRLESTVGNTPLLAIKYPLLPGTIYAKMEHMGATGSHCDRQFGALRRLEEDEVIEPGITRWDESSSGSVVASLGVHGSALGYQGDAYVPKSLPKNRMTSMRIPGTTLHPVAGYIPEVALAMRGRIGEYVRNGWKMQKHYTDKYKVITFTHPMGREAGHVAMLNHAANQQTIDAASGIAIETNAQLAEQGVTLAGYCAVIGNGTSIHATAPSIRGSHPGVAIFGIEDARNHPTYDSFYAIHPLLRHYGPHDSYGSSAHGTPISFPVKDLLDGIAIVAPQPRDKIRDNFNAQHPEFAIGNTSAMALKAGRDLLRVLNNADASIGVIFYDSDSRR